jgi:NADH dehydrogenase [ubiquinone] 1 alpha subcomplex assembly factor 1
MHCDSATQLSHEDPPEDIRMIFDSSDPQQIGLWLPVNDSVMGGLSSGAMEQASPHSALFSGVVSLENGGGFASVRTPPAEYNLSTFAGLAIRIKGDGHRYKLNLTDDRSAEGILFRLEFATKAGEWIVVSLPFDRFLPVFRGRFVADHAPLRTRCIKTFGFMIAGKQAGKFTLEIGSISAFGTVTALKTRT